MINRGDGAKKFESSNLSEECDRIEEQIMVI